MGPAGFAEFHRCYLAEFDRDGADRRRALQRRRPRLAAAAGEARPPPPRLRLPALGPPEPYPTQSPRGPMVALTNELAGSDGDIFSHGFKLLKLGPLVGKRTWGGVIGIRPRHRLADGTDHDPAGVRLLVQRRRLGRRELRHRPRHRGRHRARRTPPRGRDPQLEVALQTALAEADRGKAQRAPEADVRYGRGRSCRRGAEHAVCQAGSCPRPLPASSTPAALLLAVAGALAATTPAHAQAQAPAGKASAPASLSASSPDAQCAALRKRYLESQLLRALPGRQWRGAP